MEEDKCNTYIQIYTYYRGYMINSYETMRRGQSKQKMGKGQDWPEMSINLEKMLNFTHNQVITSNTPSHTPEKLTEIKNLITSVEWKGMRTLKVLPPL